MKLIMSVGTACSVLCMALPAIALTNDSTKSQPSSRPVEARLQDMAEESAKKSPPESQKVSREGIAEVGNSGILKKALNVGAIIPSFELPDARGKLVKSQDLLKRGPVVIVFYRGAWCPYCNLYLRSIEDYLPRFDTFHSTLVAISGENPDGSLTVAEKDSLSFPVLSDTNLIVARKFGIVGGSCREYSAA